MYHIANDKRAQRSAELICKGMLSLLAKESFENVSISAINKETGVSRATFYRLFDRVEDVLEYQCDTIFEEIGMKMCLQESRDTKALLIFFIRLWMENDVLLECLSQNGMMNILYATHIKKRDLVYAMLDISEMIGTEQFDYICYLMSYLMPMALDVWILHGKKESPEELYASFTNAYHTLGAVF